MGTIIENVTKLKYSTFLEETFFKPLKMKNTKSTMCLDTKLINEYNLAIGYNYNNTKKELVLSRNLPENEYLHWVANFYADGDIISTGRDLILWNEALRKGKIISKESLEKLEKPIILNNGKIAYGWGLPMSFVVKNG